MPASSRPMPAAITAWRLRKPTGRRRSVRPEPSKNISLASIQSPIPIASRRRSFRFSDPGSAWTAKANKRVQFGYGLNYLIDIENAVIVDVEATPARTYDEVAATQTMLDRAEERFDLRPRRLAADTAYGTGKFLGWLVKKKKIIPHIPVWEKSDRQDGIFSRSDFHWDRKRGAYVAPTGNCCRPAAPCTTDIRCCIAPRSGTATCARYERSAAPRLMRAKFRATSMRTPAISHGRR